MIENCGRINHSYVASLRFFGPGLDLAAISQRLGVDPSLTHDHPHVSASRRKRQPFWSYDGGDTPGFEEPWLSLEDALWFLARKLEGRKADISALAEQCGGTWWCGHFQSSFDGGPMLSPQLMGELAGFGCKLYIDNYFSG